MASCPKCQNDKAYIGLLSVECPNEECDNFSETQFREILLKEYVEGSDDTSDYDSFDDLSTPYGVSDWAETFSDLIDLLAAADSDLD